MHDQDYEEDFEVSYVWCFCDDCGKEMEGIPGTKCRMPGCHGELLET